MITRLLGIAGFVFSFVLRTLVVLDTVVVSKGGLRGRPTFFLVIYYFAILLHVEHLHGLLDSLLKFLLQNIS